VICEQPIIARDDRGRPDAFRDALAARVVVAGTLCVIIVATTAGSKENEAAGRDAHYSGTENPPLGNTS
jgi:hypothetical protein